MCIYYTFYDDILILMFTHNVCKNDMDETLNEVFLETKHSQKVH